MTPLQVHFQGDSITDCGRDYQNPSSLGTGYVKMISEKLLNQDIMLTNKGISGNKVCDLRQRWEHDTLSMKPDVLTILIGINDTWHQRMFNQENSLDQFEIDYRWLIESSLKQGLNRILLMEPFLLHVNDEMSSMRPDLDERIKVVHQLSEVFRLPLVLLDSLFQKECERQDPKLFAEDGVHPTPKGHLMICEAWMDKFIDAR